MGTMVGESGQLIAHALTVYLATHGVNAGRAAYRKRNRSDSENLSLEIPSSPVVPYGHGYASLITTGPLGTNATCSASLYWHAGGTGGHLGGPGALVRDTGPHLAGTTSQELAKLFTPSIKRSTTGAPSPSPTQSASSWGATGASGPYASPATCGRGR